MRRRLTSSPSSVAAAFVLGVSLEITMMIIIVFVFLRGGVVCVCVCEKLLMSTQDMLMNGGLSIVASSQSPV